MAVQIKAGRILRRGTDGLTPAQLQHLLDHPQEVQTILDDIDKRRAIFLATEKVTLEATVELEKAEAEIEKREVKLAEDRAAVENQRQTELAVHVANMGALKRRTREVADAEKALVERTEAVKAMEQDTEHKARQKETEFAERERVIETQEDVSEAREVEVSKQAKSVDDDAIRLNTALRVVTHAVEGLNAERAARK